MTDTEKKSVITTIAGTGEKGFGGDGGPATAAQLDNPFDLTFDSKGNLYFCDAQNHRIRRIDAATGIITTVAGTGEKTHSGDGGPADRASLWEPYGIAFDRGDNLYIVDRFNFRVRKVDAATGVIETIAGNGDKAHAGDGGPAMAASLLEPNDVAFSPDQRTMYIADPSDHRVRAVDLASGTIETVAGNGEAEDSGFDGPAKEAGIWGARGIAVTPDGTMYIVKKQGVALGAVDPDGTYRRVAGPGTHGYVDGPIGESVYDRPKELCLDGQGRLLIVDTELPVIRRIDFAAGEVSTVAGVADGQHRYSGDNVAATASSLARPHGVAVGPDGSIYIGDSENHRIRKVTGAG